ncbi:hypothetical protein NL676_037020 [Syzygium grande]|nr:hypothetical protein NL676_037020 [Syzygium grande]
MDVHEDGNFSSKASSFPWWGLEKYREHQGSSINKTRRNGKKAWTCAPRGLKMEIGRGTPSITHRVLLRLQNLPRREKLRRQS